MADGGIYQQDLAQIHIDGYGFHWEAAAPVVLRFLRDGGIRSGKVIDLGCGGGQWLEILADEGYEVCGVDISPSMIRAAKKRLPSGQFIVGSFADVDLPSCDAATSLGEPINYLDGKPSIKRTFRKVFQALRPGGIFVFDARESSDQPVATRTATRVGQTWACIAVIDEDPKRNTIVRHITSFTKNGPDYRRSVEIHRLKVYPKNDTIKWLRDVGFRVRSYRGYGDYRFPERQSAYVARKPNHLAR